MIGVKDFIKDFKKPFDTESKAINKAKAILKERGEKATKELVEEEKMNILLEWDNKREQGERIQKKLCEQDIKKDPENTILGEYKNFEDKVFTKNDCKLENNKTYLEKFLISNKHGVLGYADKIVVRRNTIHITDNKVVEVLYRKSGFTTATGFKVPPVYMQPPLQHLHECNYMDAVLQLSLYMYLAWENNKLLKPGKLYINHIIASEGKIRSKELIEVPYLRKEVSLMFKTKKLNES